MTRRGWAGLRIAVPWQLMATERAEQRRRLIGIRRLCEFGP